MYTSGMSAATAVRMNVARRTSEGPNDSSDIFVYAKTMCVMFHMLFKNEPHFVTQCVDVACT